MNDAQGVREKRDALALLLRNSAGEIKRCPTGAVVCSPCESRLAAIMDAADDYADAVHGQQPAPGYPRQDGDFTVIGPECFADRDGTVIAWKGENYYRSNAAQEPQPAPASASQQRRHEAQAEPPLHRLSGLIVGWRAHVRELEGRRSVADARERNVLKVVIGQVLPVVEDAALASDVTERLRTALENQAEQWGRNSETEPEDDALDLAARAAIGRCAGELAAILALHTAVSPGQQTAYDEDAEADEIYHPEEDR